MSADWKVSGMAWKITEYVLSFEGGKAYVKPTFFEEHKWTYEICSGKFSSPRTPARSFDTAEEAMAAVDAQMVELDPKMVERMKKTF